MQIRPIQPDELAIVTAWATDYGWNPGIYDADCLYEIQKSQFFVGIVDDQPVGCVASIAYTDQYGFICFFAVAPDHRGKGYGKQLWRHALSVLNTHSIGLDDNTSNIDYKQDGFREAYRNLRMSTTISHDAPELPPHQKIVSLKELPFEQIEAYEAGVFPASRPQFLRYWINNPQSHSLGFLSNDQLLGYGIIHPCQTGYKISPLLADNRGIARAIIQSFSHRIGSIPVFVDVPETNPAGVNMAMRLGMGITMKAKRYYRGEIPQLPTEKMYGVSTFEFG